MKCHILESIRTYVLPGKHVLCIQCYCRMRGLGQLVRAKNIHTIGQLSSMSESDINGLPIRSPKIATTRSALSAYAEQWKKKNDRQTPQTIENVTAQDGKS